MLNKVILAQGSHTPKCHPGEALLMLNKVVKPENGSLAAFVHLLVQRFQTREW